MLKSEICEMLGIKYPIFQGGMAWIADGKLAAAVSCGGGLGIIAAGNAPGEYVKEQIRIARSLTSKPIGVNIMLLSPFADDIARIAAEEKVEVVTTGAGNPSKYMGAWRESGIKVIPVVASVAMARLMDRLGASALIVEGGESGGHVGELTTLVLVPQVCDATEKWISGTVADEDLDNVRAFFKDFCQKKLYKSGEKPPQITYKAQSSTGVMRLYSGIFLKMDESVSLYCCRCIPDMNEADTLRTENVSLKENIQELVMRFTDGIAAFEVTTNGLVTPLYASDNAFEFFGFTKEEWLSLMKKSTPLKDFVNRSDVAYEDFCELLQNGEAEFTYFDLKTETERRIKAICSQKTQGASPGYVMLYNVEDTEPIRDGSLPENRTVSIRTFGYFDVFVGDRPIAFRNKKSKELFALLVDRRGGYISSEEAIGFLWEDEPVSPVTLARYRKVALRLKNILEEYGISEVVESVDGKRRIVTEKVQCDLYDYLSGREEFSQLFKGSYLTNYSWGENTLAELMGNILY